MTGKHNQAQVAAALHIIHATPGYSDTGDRLALLHSRGRIRFDLAMEDRAQASLLGTITLGPEAIGSSPLSIAQTLVHEYFHLRQNPLSKTVSFWAGIATRTPVMKRYEQPAYRAALIFLEAVKQVHPNLAGEAEREQVAIRQVFVNHFRAEL